jgi:hypothetical protein
MDDMVIHHLRSAVATHTPGVYQDHRLTRAILRDLCGPDQNRREISALANAVGEQVPDSLLAANHSGLPPTLGDRLARRLTDNHAIDEEAAQWAVQTWATVLKVIGLRFSPPAHGPRQSAGSAAGRGLPQAQSSIARLTGAAAQVAASVSAPGARAVALATAAAGLATTDAVHSARLLEEAEALLESVTSERLKTLQWHATSIALSATHPQQAERLALGIGGLLRDDALARLAEVLGESDLDRAMRLAWKITAESMRMHALAGLATLAADASPDRGTSLARRLTAPYWQTEALCNVAAVVAIDDRSRGVDLVREAEGVARAIVETSVLAAALSSVARILARIGEARAATVFEEAEMLARSADAGASALASLAIALAPTEPDRALRIAASLEEDWYATGEIVKALARSEPDRALRLAQSITTQTPHLADVAVTLAHADPDGALLLARSITDERWEASALAGIARVLVTADPARAAHLLDDVEQLAGEMADGVDKVAVLVDLAAAWATG